MARVSPKQHSFARGEISPRLYGRQDTELYYTALEVARNYVVDGRGILDRRPGTRLLGHTKNDGPATLVPFVYDQNQSYILEMGEQYLRAWFDFGQVLDGGVPSEAVTPYTADDAADLSFAQSRDIMWIAHAGYEPATIKRTTANTFEHAAFPTRDGPYDDTNANIAHFLEIDGVANTLTATGGHTPFLAGRDEGRLVRLLEEDATAAPSDPLEERFEWHNARIVSVTSSTVAVIDWDGGDVPATADWRLGAFYPGSYPSVVAFHEQRLCYAVRNRVYLSAPGDFDNFAPSDVDSSVNPDNAITLSIPAISAKKGATSDVTFLQSLGFQLVVGTPSGLHTIQATTLGEGFDASNPPTRRPQDSRGAALNEPIVVGDSVIYLHAKRKKLMGTYYKDSYDRIGAQDLSLPSDHIVAAKIKGVTWQEEPHSIAWCHMDDGTFAGLTIQPEEKVQAWHSHRLGGQYVAGGVTFPAQVESMASIPTPEGGDDRVHLIGKRTINGATVRHVEVIQPFRELGEDLRNAWYLDAALKYSGNTDPAKQITFTGEDNLTRSATTNFSDPQIIAGEPLIFHDGVRWHHGLVKTVTVDNDFTWTPTTPNAPPGPPDGRLHYVDGGWVQLPPGSPIDVYACTYQNPVIQGNISKWSKGVTSIAGLEDYEGAQLDLLLDGFPVLQKTVEDGEIDSLPFGHVILAGFGYDTRGRLLSIEAGSQNGSAQNKQRPVYEVAIDVLETQNLEAGTDMPSSYLGDWQQFDPVKFPDQHAIIEGMPGPLYSGIVRVSRDEQGEVDDPSVAWRQLLPLPSTIRGVITRLSESDGR